MTLEKTYWSDPVKAQGYLLDSNMGYYDRLINQLCRMVISVVATNSKMCNELIIDLGSGPGNCSKKFIEAYGFKNLLAVDLSEPMLNLIPWNIDLQTVKVTFQKDDLNGCKLNVPNGMASLVTATRSLDYVRNIEHVMTEASRVLKVEGYFAFNILLHQGVHTCIRVQDSKLVMDYFVYNLNYFTEIANRNGFKPLGINLLTDSVLKKHSKDAMVYLFVLQKKFNV